MKIYGSAKGFNFVFKEYPRDHEQAKWVKLEDADAAIAERDAKIELLRAHLTDIANPIAKLQREAAESDCKLDGHQARVLANDAHWLRDLARSALLDA